MTADQLTEQAAVTQWPLRILLVLLTLAVIALALWGLNRGWRRRERRQGLTLPPADPATLAAAVAAPAVTGSYIGTIHRGRLLERVVAGGTRAAADVHVTGDAVVIDRQGEAPLVIPTAHVQGLSTAAGMLQRHFGGHGLLMIDWDWAGTEVTTGLWFADAAAQLSVRDQISARIGEGVS